MENTHIHPKILKFEANMEFPDGTGGGGGVQTKSSGKGVRVWIYSRTIHLSLEHTLGKCKLATVTSYKADVSSVSPSSERINERIN